MSEQPPYESPYAATYEQAYQHPYQPAGRDPDKRPGTVTAAGIVTIVLSVLSLLACGAMALVLVLARGDIVEDIEKDLTVDEREIFSGSDLATIVLVLVALVAVWCLVAILLAVLAMRRSNVARIMLVVSSVVTALLSLLSVLFLFVTLLTLIAGIAVVVLLFTGGANEWYSADRRRPDAAGPPR